MDDYSTLLSPNTRIISYTNDRKEESKIVLNSFWNVIQLQKLMSSLAWLAGNSMPQMSEDTEDK